MLTDHESTEYLNRLAEAIDETWIKPKEVRELALALYSDIRERGFGKALGAAHRRIAALEKDLYVVGRANEQALQDAMKDSEHTYDHEGEITRQAAMIEELKRERKHEGEIREVLRETLRLLEKRKTALERSLEAADLTLHRFMTEAMTHADE
jgi:hypothetical protein